MRLASSAAASQAGVPLPHGWIGTTSQWVQGFGVAFVVLNVILLVLAWRRLRAADAPSNMWGWLLVAVGLVPIMVAFMTFAHGLENTTTVSACGSCHVMTPFVRDLQDVKSDTLAATHFKNRFIRESQCYTCHSDYGLGGTLKAKFAGLGHVAVHEGLYDVPIKIAPAYPNFRCLAVTGLVAAVPDSAHEADPVRADSGETSCLTCHGPAHPEQKKEARR